MSSYVFRFCEYHRMFMHYTTIIWVLNIYDLYIGIPVDDLNLFLIYQIITGIVLFIILYMYVKNHKGLLLKIVDNIDSGNSNISEDEAI